MVLTLVSSRTNRARRDHGGLGPSDSLHEAFDACAAQ